MNNYLHDFGPVHCIHMNERTDRLEGIEELKVKTKLPIEYFSVERHPKGGMQGCFESHVQLMKQNNEKKWCFILEDDAQCSEYFSQKRLAEVLRFANSRADWDIIFLGCFPDVLKGYQVNITGNMYRVHATQTHAYMVSRSFMKLARDWEYRGIPIDEEFKLNARCYASLPSLFVQSNTYSDVEKSIIPISKSPFKKCLTELVEMYAQEIGLPFEQCIALCVVLYLLVTFSFK
jgi:hypothetical protein